ncbi:MAG: arsenate reductase ArsC [Gallionella sp.]|nr:arsenate reductase ArsC [Gallionella sp.]MDD5612417.1 arsenate reductase ArsC [Gallionella sp.]
MSDKPYKILLLCTGNAARSIMAEVLVNALGKGNFIAYSAGTHPFGYIHPDALALLRSQGRSTEGLRSKSWDEFSGPDAPELDFIITVCDKAAGEACPVWQGMPATAHWGIPDPALVVDAEARRIAFIHAEEQLARRIQLFMSLPIKTLDQLTLKEKLAEIGRIAG